MIWGEQVGLRWRNGASVGGTGLEMCGDSVWDWVECMWGTACGTVLEICGGDSRWDSGDVLGTAGRTGLKMCWWTTCGICLGMCGGEHVGLGSECVGDSRWDSVGDMWGTASGTLLEMCD